MICKFIKYVHSGKKITFKSQHQELGVKFISLVNALSPYPLDRCKPQAGLWKEERDRHKSLVVTCIDVIRQVNIGITPGYTQPLVK